MEVKADLPPGVTHWDGPPLEAWDAWRPQEAARRLAGCAANWCVVGGWSIDLYLGAETRKHEDLEIAIPHGDLPLVRAALGGLAFHEVGDGEVRRLAPGEDPRPGKHQNWLLDEAAQAWRLDVMMEPGDAQTWVFRRDERIVRPRDEMVARTPGGIPYLRPEGALLYKAKIERRPKDEADFASCLPRLDAAQRAWLHGAIATVHPEHPWLDALA